MQFLRQKFASSPEFARIFPFVVFLALTSCQGHFGLSSVYWIYLLKTLVGAWLILEARPFISEMRWAFSWEAVLVGVAVTVVWVGLDGLYPRLSKPESSWHPEQHFGFAGWIWNAVRLAGSSVVVPPLEEVFYRSFLYRYFVRLNFLTMPLGQMHWLSFLVTSSIFGLVHPERWLAGILCGYAMTAHALTNFLLGIWVIWKQDWSFW
jgi:uncharacterized protein